MDFSFDQVAVQKPALRTGEDCMEIRIGDENDVKFSYDSNYDLFGSHRLRCDNRFFGLGKHFCKNLGNSLAAGKYRICYRELP